MHQYSGTGRERPSVYVFEHPKPMTLSNQKMRQGQRASGVSGTRPAVRVDHRPPPFFGMYLCETGRITEEQLQFAASLCEERNQRLGAVAVELGYMTERQVRIVHAKQRRVDAPFGALAVSTGFLSVENLERACRVQRDRRVRIGDVLTQLGIMTREEIEEAHRRFAESRPDDIELDPYLTNPAYEAIRPHLTKLLMRVAGVEAKLAPGQQAPLDGLAEVVEVQIGIESEVETHFGLTFERCLCVTLAARMLEVDETECDAEIADSCLHEFANILAGQIQGALRSRRHSESGAPPPARITLPRVGAPPEPCVRSRVTTPLGCGALLISL